MAQVTFLVCLLLMKNVMNIRANFEKGKTSNIQQGAGDFQVKARNCSTPRGQKGPRRSDMPKIFGGRNARRNEFPYQAVIIFRDEFRCGGILVKNNFVITAAHCVDGLRWDQIKVRLGAYSKAEHNDGERDMDILRYFIHPQYDKITHEYDIAIIETKYFIPNGNSIKPFDGFLPRLANYVGEVCVVTGWGSLNDEKDKPNILQKTYVPIVTEDECKETYGIKISDSMLCAGYLDIGVGACHGDSGGPLVCYYNGREYLTGITSWGRGCGRYYGVYTKIAHDDILNWILAKLD